LNLTQALKLTATTKAWGEEEKKGVDIKGNSLWRRKRDLKGRFQRSWFRKKEKKIGRMEWRTRA